MHKLNSLVSRLNTKIVLFSIAGLLLAVTAGWMTIDILQRTTTRQQAVDQASSAPTLRIVALDGTVEVQIDDDWQPVAAGDTLAAGQTLRTARDARTELTSSDGNTHRLAGGTTLRLRASDDSSMTLDNLGGQIYSRVLAASHVVTVGVGDYQFSTTGAAFRSLNTVDTKGAEVYSQSVTETTSDTQIDQGSQYTGSDELTLGDIALDNLSDDAFLAWNIALDKKASAYKTELGVLPDISKAPAPAKSPQQPTPTPTPSSGASLSLSGSATSTGIALSWNPTNVSTAGGFKLIYSKANPTPTFGVDASLYISTPNARAWTVELRDGASYYLRACTYDAANNRCTLYSNTIRVTAPHDPKPDLVRGALSLSASGTSLSWSLAGTAPQGYKIVMSTSGIPSYPANSKVYLDKQSIRSYNLDGLKDLSSGTYTVRVCKYTGTGCVDYSNSATVTIP